jgi:serine/threonine protein kinase
MPMFYCINGHCVADISHPPSTSPQFGTPYYMAPEAHPTAKADIFAVGIMACEMAARYLAVEGAPPLILEYSIAMRDRLVADAVGRAERNYPALARLLAFCTHSSPAARCTSTEALDMVRTAAAAITAGSPGRPGGAGREGPQSPGTPPCLANQTCILPSVSSCSAHICFDCLLWLVAGFTPAFPGHIYRRLKVLTVLSECGISRGLQDAIAGSLVGSLDVDARRLASIMNQVGLSPLEAASVEDRLVSFFLLISVACENTGRPR